jgi:DNA-directed RNA polymerase omega subunit
LQAAGDSKFTLVAAASKRAREINDYWNGLGKGSGRIVPPQVVSRSNKSLTMALEEIAEDQLAIRRPTAEELEEERAAAEAEKAAADDFDLLSDVRPSDSFNEPESL